MTFAPPKPELDAAVYKTLLESTKAIPWKIDWGTMKFAYIGPQIETILGWTTQSWLTVQDWADRMHPADRDKVVNFCVSQSQAGVDHEVDYRALNRDGGYVWFRDVVHVVRKPDGSPEALVGFMFDISERKKSEEEVLRLQQELRDLSFKDALTGLGNRRQFDSAMASQWQAAQRGPHSLAVIMLDIDFFKQYNDHYGHFHGDQCLQQVAQALQRGATRPGDLFFRQGGEEFAVVLPETDLPGALLVAERCRRALSEQAIAHAYSAVAKTVTVSMGVGSLVPSVSELPAPFLDLIDRRLYRAKQNGRNAIVLSDG